MTLTIKENNGTYQLEGALNVNTVKYFENHCEMLLKASGKLTIDIEKTSFIDTDGLQAIIALFNNAKTNQTNFCVIGTGCKDIYDEMRFTNTAA